MGALVSLPTKLEFHLMTTGLVRSVQGENTQFLPLRNYRMPLKFHASRSMITMLNKVKHPYPMNSLRLNCALKLK